MPKARRLRTYSHIAREEHDCDNCWIGILKGDLYHGEVWAYAGFITVKKYHDSCPFDPDDEDDFEWKSLEKETLILHFPQKAVKPRRKAA